MRSLIPFSLRKLLGNAWFQISTNARREWKLLQLRGDSVECNICRWHGRAFADSNWHAQSICPSCNSDVRHRLLMACWMLNPIYSLSRTISNRRVLHFAPEQILREFVSQNAGHYLSADFDRGDVDLKLDLSKMDRIDSSSVDTVIAIDVLEHVPDDRAAMREIYRILSTTGLAILSIPQKDSPAQTDEDVSIIDEQERIRRFGQRDHLRIYGDDFILRLQNTGFLVDTLSAADFSLKENKRFGLNPKPNPHPLATNNRRIYFAWKNTSSNAATH